jgi:serine/threonine protein phosphatase PrpC
MVTVAPTTPAVASRVARTAGASVCGVTHERDGLPNQDALAVWQGGADGAGLIVAAVADGHGGARHFRSAVGSRLAVNAAVEATRRFAPEWESADPARQAQIASSDLPVAIVTEWLDQVRQHLASHPLSAAERQALESESASGEKVQVDPTFAYGATLITALVTRRQMLLLQVGDGDALLVGPDGRAWRPIPPDRRLTGEFTTSLCRPGAQADFRNALVELDNPGASLLLLATDGYSNSFRTEGDFLQVGTDLLQMVRQQGVARVEKQLPQILEHASTNGSGDDITLALVYLGEPGQRARDSLHAAPSSARPSELRAELASLRSQFQRYKAMVAAVAVIAVVALVWAFRGEIRRLPSGSRATGPHAAGPVVDLPSLPTPSKDKPPAKDTPGQVSDSGSGAEPKAVVSISARRAPQAVKITGSVTLTGAAEGQCSAQETLSGPGFPNLGSASAEVGNADSDGKPVQLNPVSLAAPKDAKQRKAFDSPEAKASIQVTCDGKAIASATVRVEK